MGVAKLIDFILGRDSEEELVEITKIKKSRYGLPYDIWVSPRMGQHGPRIKVATKANSRFGHDDSITLSIEADPKLMAGDPRSIASRDLADIKRWIAANRTALLKHWSDDQYDDLDLQSELKPLN